MDDQDSEQDKSEEATPFKLTRARRRGVVARGMDLAFLVSVSTALGFFWFGGPFLAERVSDAVRGALVSASTMTGDGTAIIAVTGEVMLSAAKPVAIAAISVFVIVLLAEAIQTGVVFSSQPLKPDFNRMNPAKNLKRIFSLRQLFETFKNVFKLAAYGSIAFGVIWYARSTFADSLTDARSVALAIQDVGLRLLFFFVLAAAVVAILDQIIVRKDFAKRMRMSRRELKREMKDREGDPRMKQQRKKLHGEFSKMSQSTRNVRDADLLITNPTHFAVALRYDSKTMNAPRVVARGSHQFAKRLRHLAFLYGVVIIEDPRLARALYQKSKLNREIPDLFFEPVASIYHQVRRKKQTTSALQASVHV